MHTRSGRGNQGKNGNCLDISEISSLVFGPEKPMNFIANKKKSHQQKFLSILWSSICGRYGNETVPGPVSKDSGITAETEVQPMQGLGSDKATKIQMHQLLQNNFFLTSNSWSVPHKDPDIFRNK